MALFIKGGGVKKVDPIYQTGHGISVGELPALIALVAVVAIILGIALATGKRGFCHYGCWMGPFMVIGRKIRNAGGWPSLQLVPEREKCTNCKKCEKVCPTSLEVNSMVAREDMENSECILCEMCVDNCPKQVITYAFKPHKKASVSPAASPSKISDI